MSVFGGGDTQNTQPAFGSSTFGTPGSMAQPQNLTSQAGATTNLFGGTNTSFGSFGSTTTSAVFGTTQTAPSFSSSMFSTGTSTSTAFPAMGQTVTSTPAAGNMFGGGFVNPAAASTATFGAGSLVPAISTAVPNATIGLGGVDIQSSSGLSGSTATSKKDGKTVKETQIPNEISITVEAFKKYVKEQKAIREVMSRVSSKNISKVQELVGTLRQQLSVVSNGLHRNAVAIAKLKEETNQELKNVEIAQRTRDSVTSVHYENNASAEYFHNLANNFEKQMQCYRQQIEQLERHLLSLSQPYTLTPNEWTAIRRRLHDTFVTLAAQLQTVHQEVQLYKEQFINNQRINHSEMRMILDKCKENMKGSMLIAHLPPSLTYGPSPFAAVQSAVGKAITNVFNHSQKLPGSTGLGSYSSLESGAASRHMMLSLSAKCTTFQSVTPFKPLGK